MSGPIIALGSIGIAAGGMLVIVGARKLGWRVLTVGVILIAAAAWLSPHISQAERPDAVAH